MHKATIIFVIILCMIFGGSANAASLITRPASTTTKAIYASQTENLKHSRYVCKYGDNHNQRWHCKAKVWLLREWKETHIKLNPPVLNIRAYVEKHHPCLASIIRGENRAYDPTLDFGGGHGNVDEAYGIPQANPGTKMKSAGKDWRTNPWTQLKWMIKYAVSRYGSECQAMNFRYSNGWY